MITDFIIVATDGGEFVRTIGARAMEPENKDALLAYLNTKFPPAPKAELPGHMHGKPLDHPSANATLTQREISRSQGFSGDSCDACGGFSMKRAGTCLTCQDCGATTGCS